MRPSINYQQIYEEELSHSVRDAREKPDRFFELSHQDRLMVEELVDIGYRRAIEEALEPELLEDTAALSADMAAQLYNFANMLKVYLQEQGNDEGSLIP